MRVGKWKGIVIRIVMLAVIFAAAVFGVFFWMGRGSGSGEREMQEATFPLVYLTYKDTQINCLHGYSKPMQVTAMRDTITPLNTDRTLNVQIKNFGRNIKDLNFQVITLDGKTILEKTKVTNYQTDGEYVKATLELQNQLLMNQEYVVQIQVTTGNQNLYYYTRIVRQDGLHTEEYLNYVLDFYQRCMDGEEENLNTIAAMIETDYDSDNSTLASMNIHNNVDVMTWGALDPQIVVHPVPSIKEINGTTASIVLEYTLSAQNEQGQTELYQVEEFYRLRYTSLQTYLLDFERTTNQIFDPELDNVVTKDGINLGIGDREVEYRSDDQNRFVAFVRGNSLWSYDVDENKIAQVFDFRQSENSDERDCYRQNSIKVIEVDNSGNIYFSVTGYMNRGTQEGKSGVALYYYDASLLQIEQLVFVDTLESYEMMKRDVEMLNYVSQDKTKFYFMLDGTVYEVGLDTRSLSIVITDLNQDCYASSDTNRHFAWLAENDPYQSVNLNVMDLETKEVRTISAGEAECIKIIGFMEEDIVYGLADAAEIQLEHAGAELFPMKLVVIENVQGDHVKEYTPNGCYVTEGIISEKLLTLKRVQKTEGTFQEIADDQIVSNMSDTVEGFGITTKKSKRKLTEIVLMSSETLENKTPKVVHSKEAILEENREVTIVTQTPDYEVYYVYGRGMLDSIYTSANLAIQRADEIKGVVVDAHQQYIWERGNKDSAASISLDEIPDVMKQCVMDNTMLEEALGKTVLDLSGCSWDMILYFIDKGSPVLAQIDGQVILITGYDQFDNIMVLYQGAQETVYWGSDDSDATFPMYGNLFMTYINR
ncbi:MAG: hypothetical protein SO016_02645 [Lachnospiraceae bacterium]|nr:hypothetical protein [Robinsoniella sp.]MDY3765583.1 hypothetical protein [Lachnospiraceae bacterium]